MIAIDTNLLVYAHRAGNAREWRFYIQDMLELSGKERTWNIQPS